MEFELFCENVKGIINRYARCEINKQIKKMDIELNGYNLSFTQDEYDKLINNVTLKQGCYILKDGYYEVMLDFISDYSYYIPRARLRMEKYEDVIYVDDKNGISYSFGCPSIEYILVNFKELKYMTSYFDTSKWMHFREELINCKEDITIYKILRKFYRSVITLKLKTNTNLDVDNYNKYVDAFLYNLAYNNNIVLKRATSFQERNRLIQMKNIRTNDEIIVPQRIYNSNLIEQYCIANSSFDPFIQFISYYHIFEHFYESIYNEDLINKLKLEMTSPNFSIKMIKILLK